MKNLLQPFKVCEDTGLFLVNIERACSKADFARESWPQHLLTVLPCGAAEVVVSVTNGLLAPLIPHGSCGPWRQSVSRQFASLCRRRCYVRPRQILATPELSGGFGVIGTPWNPRAKGIRREKTLVATP